MENKKKTLADRPLLAGFAAFLMAVLGSYVIGLVLGIGLRQMRNILGITASTDAVVATVYILIILLAAACMYIFYRLNRKNGYRGAVKIRGKNLTDVWVCLGIFVAAAVVRAVFTIVTIPDSFQEIQITLNSVLICIFAGVAEEICTRGIPLPVIMRGKPDNKRIRLAIFMTAVIFGLVHMLNGGGGAGMFQVFFAFLAGLFFAAVYLRTGSILVTIVFHFLYDFIALNLTPSPDDDTNIAASIIVMFIVELLPLVYYFVIARKSKLEEIKETWADIWGE